MGHGVVKDVMEMVSTIFCMHLLYISKRVMFACELAENLPPVFQNLIQCL